jgi:hypothetical protein
MADSTATSSRIRAALSRTTLGHPCYVWLVWAAAAAVLAACPMMLSDPAMWLYVADPELLALIVILGIQYTRLELAILGVQARAVLSQVFRRGPLSGHL